MKTIDNGIYNAKTRHVEYGPKGPNKQSKQTKMGEVSNLITDMTIQKASPTELARAVRHSMVVIDAEKHHLNERQSYLDNNIKIDPETGKKIYSPKNETYVDSKGVTKYKTQKSTRMAETDDARTLISKANTVMENVYATHANQMKALGNKARKTYIQTPPTRWNPSAKTTYSKEVASLKSQLNTALKNAPLERNAQVIANAVVKQKTQANPGLTSDERKKVEYQALNTARLRVGAKKRQVTFSPREWEAVQAGAISNNMLESILANTNLDTVKKLATPREPTVMTSAKQARARSLLASGATPSEVAEALGVALSTLTSSMSTGK